MPSNVELAVGDLTQETVDAIVNAANSSLLGGGGVDGAIHRKGGPAILAECRALRASHFGRGLRTGQAVATTGGLLAARWVIHTVGPVWSSSEDRSPLLRDCYHNALAIAVDLGARTVAFPLISSGVYGWPKPDAVRQALTAIQTAAVSVDLVRLMLFDAQTYAIAEQVRRGIGGPDVASERPISSPATSARSTSCAACRSASTARGLSQFARSTAA